MKEFMKRGSKVGLALLLVLTTIFGTQLGQQKTEAANEQFTLGAIPVPKAEVAYDAGNTATVTDSTTFRTAYVNTSIKRIVLNGNITLSNTDLSAISAAGLTRSLQIDGQGHTLTFTGDNVVGIFNISGTTPNSTFHLKDLNITKTANDASNVLLNGGNANWEYILDNVTNNTGVRIAWFMVNGANINVFFRNNVTLTRGYEDYFQGIKDVIFQPGCNVNITRNADGTAIFYDDSVSYDSVAYFGTGSNVDIEGTNSFPIFYPWKQFDAYPNSNVHLHKTIDGDGVQDSYGVNQVYRIDSGATFKMTNGSGPALYDIGNTIDFRANSGASVELVGNRGDVGGGALFTNGNSKIILEAPKYFNIQNKSIANSAFYSASTTNPALQILNSNIGAWNKNIAQTGPPTTPSPFNGVTLNSGRTTALTGTSPELNTMPGGWNTSNYARIAFATMPSITADDLSVALNRTKPITATYTPTNGTLSYSSNNTGIATVNASGVVTGTGEGSTTIRVTITTPEGVTAFDDITVTVTNNKPTLTVPAFTEVPLGGTFDPKAGVVANDVEDGNLIDDVVITNPVNTGVAGVYSVNYSVTDSDGNNITAKQIVLVNDGTFTAGTNNILKASNFTKRVGEVDTADAAVKTAANVAVYNKTTGAIDAGATVNVTSQGGLWTHCRHLYNRL